MQQSVFRFQDLPPELRDIIYALAMEGEGVHRLVDGLTGTARALSQVSRAVRADATRIFSTKNSFLVRVGLTAGSEYFTNDSRRLDDWKAVWGTLILPHIHSLKLACGVPESCRCRVSIKLKDTAKPASYGNHNCYLSYSIRESDMNRIAFAVFKGHGGQAITYEQLLTFLTAVQKVMAELGDTMRIAKVAEVLSRIK